MTALALREQHQAITDTDATAAFLAGETGGGVPGDCWRTALACLLEVPRDEVPHFVHEYPLEADPDPDLGARWWRESVAWVERIMPAWTLCAYRPGPWPFYGSEVAHDAPDRVILSGKSPRGDWQHVVLVNAVDGELAWDPHPAGGGVLAPIVDRVALVRREWL